MAEFHEFGRRPVISTRPEYGDYEKAFDREFGYGYPEDEKEADKIRE